MVSGVGRIELFNKKEKVRASLGLAQNGQPALQLLDNAERVHAWLEMGTEGDPGLNGMTKQETCVHRLAHGKGRDSQPRGDLSERKAAQGLRKDHKCECSPMTTPSSSSS